MSPKRNFFQFPLPLPKKENMDIGFSDLTGLCVKLTGATEVDGEIIECAGGIPVVRFNPPASGIYFCQIFRFGERLLTKPYEINVDPENLN